MAELVVLTNSNLFPFLMAETIMILSSALKYVWQLSAGLYMHQKVCAVGTEVDSIQLYCGKKSCTETEFMLNSLPLEFHQAACWTRYLLCDEVVVVF
jgi:hypothetical protein